MNRRSAEQLAKDLLGRELSALTDLERDVIDRIATRRVSSLEDLSDKQPKPTLGQRIADRVAAVGGSWGFIISFALVLFGWMLINSPMMQAIGIQFDPFPFIFLNLMLSMLAAVQAPIIMMSQNRQSEIDRQTTLHDYEVNLRAELEIILLHENIAALQRDVAQLVEAQGIKGNRS